MLPLTLTLSRAPVRHIHQCSTLTPPACPHTRPQPQAAQRKLDAEREELHAWGAKLQALTADLATTKEHMRASRQEQEQERDALGARAAALAVAEIKLEERRSALADARVALDRWVRGRVQGSVCRGNVTVAGVARSGKSKADGAEEHVHGCASCT